MQTTEQQRATHVPAVSRITTQAFLSFPSNFLFIMITTEAQKLLNSTQNLVSVSNMQISFVRPMRVTKRNVPTLQKAWLSNNCQVRVFYFFVAQQPKSGPDRLIVRFLGHTYARTHTHTHTHTHTVGLLWTGDQLVAEVPAYTTHNKHVRRTSMPMPSAGFETQSQKSSGRRPTL